jgi:replicative DNA helicase
MDPWAEFDDSAHGNGGGVAASNPPLRHQGQRVSTLIGQLREGTFESLGLTAIGTGFEPLDSVLDGGFLPGEVILLGGQPGAGKTICALQWARNICIRGRRVTFACFEHDEATLMYRLLVQEMASETAFADATTRIQARAVIRDLMLGVIDLQRAAALSPLVMVALEKAEAYAPKLQLVRASSQHTTPDELELTSLSHLEPGGVLVVDYLQKLPVPAVPNLDERVYRAVEILKELAIRHQISVVALSAAAADGIGVDRLRLSHLRGSDALAHECDVAVVLNHKSTATSDRHLKFDSTQLDEARRRTIFSIEKNRRGEVDIHLDFEKDFANFRFNPHGTFMSEALEGD